MDKDHVVHRYMETFFRTGDYASLREIFSEDLKFRGSLYQFDSAEDYINSLIASPAVNCDFEILEEHTNTNSVCLIYNFKKDNIETLMAQTFLIEAGLIQSIRLVFNVQDII